MPRQSRLAGWLTLWALLALVWVSGLWWGEVGASAWLGVAAVCALVGFMAGGLSR
jgi:hypothetical protein